MPFLAQESCVDHGVIAQTGVCCPGLTPWSYDANTNEQYNGFGCWNATCAQEGQYGPQCCEGLTTINGKCAKPTSSPGCVSIGKAPLAGQLCCTGLVKDSSGICNTVQSGGGDWLSQFVNSSTLIWVGAGLVLLMAMGKKR